MLLSDSYHDALKQHIGKVAASNGRLTVVFGASKAGWYVMKVLQANSIAPVAFCDNDNRKIGKLYHGYPVLSPEKLKEKYPHAMIFIGVFRAASAAAVGRQLAEIGLSVASSDVYPFLYSYFMNVAGRQCSPEAFAGTIRNLSLYYEQSQYQYGHLENTGLVVSPFVTGVITQKCNLRCHDCGQSIPHYEAPQNFPVDSIIEEIRQYCSAFDLVPEISLHGGEPFLHADVGVICREISKIPNLAFINLITNGKIVPSESTLRDLWLAGADLHQSDYGKLSKHQQEISLACDAHGIFCDIHFINENEQWVRSAPPKRHARTQEDNDALYQKCTSTRICCQIMGGKLYRCPKSAHATAQGQIPDFPEDAVELTSFPISQEERIGNIRNFLMRKKALSACDYCDPNGAVWVVPAIQLSGRNRAILKNGGQI